MADLFSPDEIALITGNYGQGAGLGGAPQGWGPQPAVSDGDGAPAAPAPAPASPWAGLGSIFGGGGGAQSSPGMSQGMIGLGLGLLAGNPFDRYSAALKGYQAGASQDEARFAQAQNEAFRRAQLAETSRQHREMLALKEEELRKIDLTNDIRNFNFYKQQGGTLPFMDWQQQQLAQQSKLSLRPEQMWVLKDPNDPSKGYDLKFFQPSNRPGVGWEEARGLPEGAVPAQQTRIVQTTEGAVPITVRLPPPTPTAPTAQGATTTPPAGQTSTAAPPGPTTGTPIAGTNPWQMQQAKTEGTIAGKQRMALPDMESNAARVIDRINKVLSDPSLPNVTGMIGGRIPEGMATEGMARVNSYLKEIQSADWLVGIQAMRNMGALSNREGQRVEEARNRLLARTTST